MVFLADGGAKSVLLWAGGAATTVVGSWVSSKIRVYHDHRRAHLEDLQNKILIPIRSGLDDHLRPLVFNLKPILFVQMGATIHFDFQAKASEEQVEQGDIMVALFPSSAIFNALDPALLEDATKVHFAEQLSPVEKFIESWGAYAGRCHAWAVRISQEILKRSGLPAFPYRFGEPGFHPYVTHLRLAVFVYKRLFRLQAPALRLSEEYATPHWTLSGEECVAASGTREQMEGLVSQIDKIIESERSTALYLQSNAIELQQQFQALFPKLDHAIAARRLQKSCDLVPFF